MINIRPFHTDDLDDVIALWRELGLATPQNDSKKDIDRKLKVNPELFLVAQLTNGAQQANGAQQGDEIVGSVMGGYEGHRGWINYLGVASRCQRQGIASLLMSHVEAELLAKGCPKINLQVRNANTSVLAFYAARGYFDDNVVGLGKRLIHDN